MRPHVTHSLTLGQETGSVPHDGCFASLGPRVIMTITQTDPRGTCCVTGDT